MLASPVTIVQQLRPSRADDWGVLLNPDPLSPAGAAPLRLRTAIQFSAEDVGLAEAVARASVVDLGRDLRLRVATVSDLIVLKLAAAEEPSRRPSKREHDVADVLALLEEHPELNSAELMARVQDVRLRLVSAGFGGQAPEAEK